MRSDHKLDPGPYCIFVLRDDETWKQPVYMLGEGWTENDLAEEAERRNGGFWVGGIQRDEDAPEDCLEILGDFA